MIATLHVTVEGWFDDHHDENFEVLEPVYAVLEAAKRDGLISDFNAAKFPGGPGPAVEDPVYEFLVAGLEPGQFSELRRRVYALASSTGPDNIIDCELE